MEKYNEELNKMVDELLSNPELIKKTLEEDRREEEEQIIKSYIKYYMEHYPEQVEKYEKSHPEESFRDMLEKKIREDMQKSDPPKIGDAKIYGMPKQGEVRRVRTAKKLPQIDSSKIYIINDVGNFQEYGNTESEGKKPIR